MKISALIDKYRDEHIDSIVYSNASDIDSVALVLGIDRNYLSSQLRLHLPWFTEDELSDENALETIRYALKKLKSSLEDYDLNYKLHRKLNGIDSLVGEYHVVDKNRQMKIVDDNGNERKVFFSSIPGEFGIEIQKTLHYIHHPRLDTNYHFGLILEEYATPLCYASFSDLDRDYLYKALCNALPEGCSKPKKVSVMTRAFGYNPLPSNMMSKLFSKSSNKLLDLGYDYIITAVNPFLGFKGSIFSGSSYFPFATSPMQYLYDKDGLYLNRRNANGASKVNIQKYATPPIIWLVHPTERKNRNIFENCSDIKMYNIAAEEYHDSK